MSKVILSAPLPVVEAPTILRHKMLIPGPIIVDLDQTKQIINNGSGNILFDVGNPTSLVAAYGSAGQADQVFAQIRALLKQETYEPISIVGINVATGTHLGGTAVIITGSGFTQNTGVMFGLNSATITAFTDTTLTVTTPPGVAGVVDISVIKENSLGVTVVLPASFTYT